MRYKLFLIALLSTLSIFASDSHKYTPVIGNFDKLRVFDNVNVVYKCVPDSTGLAVYDATPEFADAFIFSNQKGVLTIQVNTEDVGKPGLPTLYVYSDFLTSAENSSSFTLTINDPTAVPSFKVKQIGNGKIIINNLKATSVDASLTTGNGSVIISGGCSEATLHMLGTGVIQADDLQANFVKCKIMGTGSIGCWASQRLEVRGIGSTKIYYKGNPEIKKVGGGNLIKLNSSENSAESSE